MAITLVSGNVSDKAVTWLKAHGATIEGFGLLEITLPEKAMVNNGIGSHVYTLSFYNAEGNDEQSYVEVELDIDAYQTSVELLYNADKQCICKGRGCERCVEELAALESGENPYAHHMA